MLFRSFLLPCSDQILNTANTNIFSPSKRLSKSGKRRKPGDRPFMWATAGRCGSSTRFIRCRCLPTSDWHRPNCRAIREGATPALTLPEWHLADRVNDGGAPSCPRRDDGRTVGNGGARGGLQNCGSDLIFVCSRFTNFASRPVKPGESNWATRHDVDGSKCVDGVTMFLE